MKCINPIYGMIFISLGIISHAGALQAEPMFDNNGFTIRDKINTIGLGYGQKRIEYKRLGLDGSAQKIEATCIDAGFAYATRKGEAFYAAISYCDNAGIADGSVSSDAAIFTSAGYIYAHSQTPLETYLEFRSINYPSVDSNVVSTRSFDGSEISLGIVFDIVDGSMFNISLGVDLDLYSNYGSQSVDRSKENEVFLKSSLLLPNDWAIVARLAGYGREGFGLTFMKSFE